MTHWCSPPAPPRSGHARSPQGSRPGPGFFGLEVAEALHLQGLAVHDSVSATAIEVGDTSDVVMLTDGTRLDADIIVLSVGVRPNTAPFESAGLECERGAIVVNEHGRTNLPGVWTVGDATLSVDAVTGIRRPVPLSGPANRAGHIPGSLNIAHTELRNRIDEVRGAASDRPVRILCQSGMRSYLAHRVLAGSGFDLATLSAGMISLRAHLGAHAESALATPVSAH